MNQKGQTMLEVAVWTALIIIVVIAIMRLPECANGIEAIKVWKAC